MKTKKLSGIISAVNIEWSIKMAHTKSLCKMSYYIKTHETFLN